MKGPMKEMLPEFERFATRHCLALRPRIIEAFSRRLDSSLKGDQTPVTELDQELEASLVASIRQHFPGHCIDGEEGGACQGAQTEGQWRWLLDPIDGTRQLISGIPLFGTLIALLHEGEPVASVLDFPALDELYSAYRGGGARCNGESIAVAELDDLASARVASTTPFAFAAEDWPRLVACNQQIHSWVFGANAYSYALLACGRLDLVIEADLKPHDYYPLAPLILEAGGVIGGWNGESLHECSGKVLAASRRSLQQQAWEALIEPAPLPSPLPALGG